MIRSRKPERFQTVHALVADENILKGVIEGVAHVQNPGDVGGRHDNGESFFVGINLGAEEMVFFPKPTPSLFRFLGIITGGKLDHRVRIK